MAGVANFSILARPLDPAAQMQDHAPNTIEYTFVASAINIALSILEHPAGRQHLTNLALAFDSVNNHGRRFHADANLAKQQVDFFLTAIKAKFPIVVIDHQMTNVNLLGTHPRGEWRGSPNEFNPRDQMVMINGGVCISFPSLRFQLIKLLAS